jgi:hypothetical protein
MISPALAVRKPFWAFHNLNSGVDSVKPVERSPIEIDLEAFVGQTQTAFCKNLCSAICGWSLFEFGSFCL